MSDTTNHLTPFTFKGTGISCFVQPVSPMLLNEARKSVPKPKPPMEEVTSADGTKRQEPNESHPFYKQAQVEYNERINALAQRVLIKRGVVLKLTDAQRDALKQLRDEMGEDGITLDADDKVAYVLHIAIGTVEDTTDLVQAITQRSQPTDPKSVSG